MTDVGYSHTIGLSIAGNMLRNEVQRMKGGCIERCISGLLFSLFSPLRSFLYPLVILVARDTQSSVWTFRGRNIESKIGLTGVILSSNLHFCML